MGDQYWSDRRPVLVAFAPCSAQRRDSPKKAPLLRGNSPLTTTTNLPSREGSVSPPSRRREEFPAESLRERPILVGGLTYIGSRRDQYRYIPSTYIGQPTDQYRFTPPLHGGIVKGPIRHSGVPSARGTKRPHEEGSTDSASIPTEVG